MHEDTRVAGWQSVGARGAALRYLEQHRVAHVEAGDGVGAHLAEDLLVLARELRAAVEDELAALGRVRHAALRQVVDHPVVELLERSLRLMAVGLRGVA